MGLEQFQTEKEEENNEIRTRKKIKNVNLDRDVWEDLVIEFMDLPMFIAPRMEEKEVKAMVQMMDEMMNPEGDEEPVEVEGLQEIRDVLVDEYIEL